RHGDAGDVLRAERLDSDRRRDRRIDPARESDDDILESAFANVIAETEDQAAADLFIFGEGQDRVAARTVEIDERRLLLERFGAEHRLAARVDDDRRTVEEQLAVATDLIDVHERRAVSLRAPREEHVARFAFAGVAR